MKKEYGLRVLFYLIGLLVLAAGLTLNTKAGLGVSPIISVAYSVSVIAGQNFGAKKYDRILEGSRKALRMVVGLSLLSTVVIILAANQVALLFLNAGETEILAGSAQMICMISSSLSGR